MNELDKKLLEQIGTTINQACAEDQTFILAIMAAYDAGKAAGAKAAAVA